MLYENNIILSVYNALNSMQNSKLCNLQEAMENFVFPNEIKTKLMKMSILKNIFYVP